MPVKYFLIVMITELLLYLCKIVPDLNSDFSFVALSPAALLLNTEYRVLLHHL